MNYSITVDLFCAVCSLSKFVRSNGKSMPPEKYFLSTLSLSRKRDNTFARLGLEKISRNGEGNEYHPKLTHGVVITLFREDEGVSMRTIGPVAFVCCLYKKRAIGMDGRHGIK